jgi:hypothetical protein
MCAWDESLAPGSRELELSTEEADNEGKDRVKDDDWVSRRRWAGEDNEDRRVNGVEVKRLHNPNTGMMLSFYPQANDRKSKPEVKDDGNMNGGLA